MCGQICVGLGVECVECVECMGCGVPEFCGCRPLALWVRPAVLTWRLGPPGHSVVGPVPDPLQAHAQGAMAQARNADNAGEEHMLAYIRIWIWIPHYSRLGQSECHQQGRGGTMCAVAPGTLYAAQGPHVSDR